MLVFFSVVLCGFLSFKISGSHLGALVSALAIALMPAYLEYTLFTASSLSLAIPLMLFSIWAFVNIESNQQYIWPFLVSIVLLMLTHQLAVIIIAALFMYALFLKLERLKFGQEEFEVVLFTLLLGTWLFLVIYKKPLLVHGLGALSLYYTTGISSALVAVLLIGILPFLLGVYGIALYGFRSSRKSIYLLIGLSLATFTALIFGFLNTESALLMLGIWLGLVAAQVYELISSYIEKTKFHSIQPFFPILVGAILIATSLPIAIESAGNALDSKIGPDLVKASDSLKSLPAGKALVGSREELGHSIKYYSHQDVFIDDDQILDEGRHDKLLVMAELGRPLTSETRAVALMTDNSITHLLFPSSHALFSTSSYAVGGCFSKEYYGSYILLELRCVVETYG
jgi:hypothetical protein